MREHSSKSLKLPCQISISAVTNILPAHHCWQFLVLMEESAPFSLMEKLVFIKSTLFFLQLTLLLILEDKLHRQLSYDLLPSRFTCKQIFVHECRSIAQWPWSGLGSDCVRHKLCLQPAFLSFLCWKSRLNPNICVWYQFLFTQTLTHSLWHVVVTCILK